MPVRTKHKLQVWNTGFWTKNNDNDKIGLELFCKFIRFLGKILVK